MLKDHDRTEAQQNVKMGAQMLDHRYPGWEKKIRVESLHLENPHQCVLGQLYGEYSCGTAQLGVNPIQAVGLGFTVWLSNLGSWDALTEEWKKEINRRLALPV